MMEDKEIEEMNIKKEKIEEKDLLMNNNHNKLCKIIQVINHRIKIVIEIWVDIHHLIILINNKQHHKEILIKLE